MGQGEEGGITNYTVLTKLFVFRSQECSGRRPAWKRGSPTLWALFNGSIWEVTQILTPDYYSILRLMTPFTGWPYLMCMWKRWFKRSMPSSWLFSPFHAFTTHWWRGLASVLSGGIVLLFVTYLNIFDNIFESFSLPILTKAQTQGSLVAGSSSDRVGRDGAKRDLGQSEVIPTDNWQLATDNWQL